MQQHWKLGPTKNFVAWSVLQLKYVFPNKIHHQVMEVYVKCVEWRISKNSAELKNSWRSMMIIPVGPAHQRQVWMKRSSRKLFWKTDKLQFLNLSPALELSSITVQNSVYEYSKSPIYTVTRAFKLVPRRNKHQYAWWICWKKYTGTTNKLYIMKMITENKSSVLRKFILTSVNTETCSCISNDQVIVTENHRCYMPQVLKMATLL
jgi:hypothetical protein